jgi:hypothetical protein
MDPITLAIGAVIAGTVGNVIRSLQPPTEEDLRRAELLGLGSSDTSPAAPVVTPPPPVMAEEVATQRENPPGSQPVPTPSAAQQSVAQAPSTTGVTKRKQFRPLS